MSRPSSISVSILSSDFSCLQDQVSQIEEGGADWLHIDVMDGHFVPNLTMGPMMVEAFRKMTRLPIDVHLMMEEPERLIKQFVQAGSDLLYVHVETCPHLHRTLQSIVELGCKAGVVLNPGTPAGAVEHVAHLVESVLVMTVNPGFSGQSFLSEVSPKITQVRRILDEKNPRAVIAVDGGIDVTTLPETYRAGAQFFIASTAVFRHPEGISPGIRALRASLTPVQG